MEKLDTIEDIEKTLSQNVGLPAEFKEHLERKLKVMKGEYERLQAVKREMRKKMKEKKLQKRSHIRKENKKNEMKKKREAEIMENGVRKGIKKLKITP